MSADRIRKAIHNPLLAYNHIEREFSRKLQPSLKYIYDDSGVMILEEDWDTLIILDACRYDIFEQVCDLPGELAKRRSVASATPDFLINNFSDVTAHDTIYISANAKVGKYREILDLFKTVGVWDNDIHEGVGQINPDSVSDPEPVIEKTLDIHQQFPDKRLIVHLVPPHIPHLVKDGEHLSANSPYRTYEAAREGEVDAETMRDVYRENLAYVIDSIKPLLQTLDGKTVISSDHGELLGEGIPMLYRLIHGRWSFYNRQKFDYGHYRFVDVPELRDVPWLELPYNDRREISIGTPREDELNEDQLDEHLRALGYRS